jgi:hypothetical protein
MGCQNKHWSHDGLLLENEFFLCIKFRICPSRSKENPIKKFKESKWQ